MKFSEMTTERCMNTMCVLAEPIGNLAGDEELFKAIQHFSSKKVQDQPKTTTIAEICKKLIPLAFGKHKEDVYKVISAMTAKPVEKIAEQPIKTTIDEVTEFFDEDFVSFFTSSVNTEA